jgi:hypothetical protein
MYLSFKSKENFGDKNDGLFKGSKRNQIAIINKLIMLITRQIINNICFFIIKIIYPPDVPLSLVTGGFGIVELSLSTAFLTGSIPLMNLRISNCTFNNILLSIPV